VNVHGCGTTDDLRTAMGDEAVVWWKWKALAVFLLFVQHQVLQRWQARFFGFSAHI
jgi:hypothetical protein